MTTAIALLANSAQISEQEMIATIKNMVISAKNQSGSTCSDAELMMVSGICATYNLNPLVKEVHAFIADGRLMVSVGINGWIKIANRNPDYDGYKQETIFDNSGNIAAIKTIIFSKSRSNPAEYTAWMNEWKMTSKKTGAVTHNWAKRPVHMLSLRSYAQAVRFALGITDIVDDEQREEMQQSEKEINPIQQQQAPQIERNVVGEIDARLASCSTLDQLNDAAKSIRRDLGEQQFLSVANELVAVKNKHAARIESESQSVVIDAKHNEEQEDPDVPF